MNCGDSLWSGICFLIGMMFCLLLSKVFVTCSQDDENKAQKYKLKQLEFNIDTQRLNILELKNYQHLKELDELTKSVEKNK